VRFLGTILYHLVRSKLTSLNTGSKFLWLATTLELRTTKFRKWKEMEIADLLDLISKQHLNLCLPKIEEAPITNLTHKNELEEAARGKD